MLVVAACSPAARTPTATLRPACQAEAYWNGSACTPRGDGLAQIDRGAEALAAQDVELAAAPLAAADGGGPLDHRSHVRLWELRGIAAAYGDDEPTAKAAFARLLALDPSHFLSYTLSPKATFVFERVRNEQATSPTPALDVQWAPGLRVGAPIPLEIEVVADPAKFLSRASLFVRTRGQETWQAADLVLDAQRPTRLVLPPIEAATTTSVELHLRAYDTAGHEVLAWASPEQPRELPLRYDPPTPWYRNWWAIGIAGTIVALGTGAIVYAVVIEPPGRVDGNVTEP